MQFKDLVAMFSQGSSVENYAANYMNKANRSQAENDYGMMNITSLERANMLAMMQNWAADHAIGATEDVFVEEYRQWARPLHSKHGKAELAMAARSAANPMQAQIRKAAELRQQRGTLFNWDDPRVSVADAAINAVNTPKSLDLEFSAAQACQLDALLHQHKQIRLLFTTWRLVQGNLFLRVLASSQTLYDRGFIMNPSILSVNAPAQSAIHWDIRLNDFFLHSGMERNAAFVFVTQQTGYETFLDPKTRTAAGRDEMTKLRIGENRNYPVKPGGSEILTLLEYGYGLDMEHNRAFVDSKIGFVMVPGRGGGRRRERFLEMHASFNQAKYDRLMAFTRELASVGVYN